MGSPVAKFPSTVWGGTSANFARADRNVYHPPNADDWDQAVSEIIALEVEVTRLEALTASTGGSFDAASSGKFALTLTGDTVLSLSNASVGQEVTLLLTQDGVGSHLVTWFSGIKWAGGSAPTLTTTASKTDVIKILKTAAGAYLGWVPAADA